MNTGGIETEIVSNKERNTGTFISCLLFFFLEKNNNNNNNDDDEEEKNRSIQRYQIKKDHRKRRL